MIRKLSLSLCAVFCALVLTSCGASRPDAPVPPLYDALGLTPDEVLVTIDGRGIPAWRYLCWLAYDCRQLADAYRAQGMKPDWAAPADEAPTLADYVRLQALADTALYATVETWAAQYGAVPPEGDHSALEAEAGSRFSAFLETLSPLELRGEDQQELLSDAVCYRRLLRLFSTAGSPLAPQPEALGAYADEQGYLALDWIQLPVSGQDPAAVRQQAESLFSQLNAGGSSPSLFAQLAGQARIPFSSLTFTARNSPLPASIETAAQALEENQCSGILEAEDAFYLLLRRSPDMDVVRNDYFDSLLLSASQDAEIKLSPAWESLDVDTFYTLFSRASSPDPSA